MGRPGRLFKLLENRNQMSGPGRKAPPLLATTRPIGPGSYQLGRVPPQTGTTLAWGVCFGFGFNKL